MLRADLADLKREILVVIGFSGSQQRKKINKTNTKQIAHKSLDPNGSQTTLTLTSSLTERLVTVKYCYKQPDVYSYRKRNKWKKVHSGRVTVGCLIKKTNASMKKKNITIRKREMKRTTIFVCKRNAHTKIVAHADNVAHDEYKYKVCGYYTRMISNRSIMVQESIVKYSVRLHTTGERTHEPRDTQRHSRIRSYTMTRRKQKLYVLVFRHRFCQYDDGPVSIYLQIKPTWRINQNNTVSTGDQHRQSDWIFVRSTNTHNHQ